ncbi:MAG: secondary thiamine-phosphate synthase enzyme, partial [Bacteroidetes bacterium QS_4_64_154]
MATHQDRIELSTSGHRDMHNLTEPVTSIVHRSNIDAGLVHVHNVGSTGAVGTIEFEPGLQQDLPEIFDELFPPGREYAHEQRWHDGNGH